MKYVQLGRTGLRVSRVCLGMMSFGKHESREWTLDEAEAEPIVRSAVEGGITFFDTADVYNGGAERGHHRAAAAASCSRCARSTWSRPRLGADDARRERLRAVAQAHPRLDRRLARAARARLRRPVPDPSLGPVHADRGDDGRAG